jgi:hypothetical protein
LFAAETAAIGNDLKLMPKLLAGFTAERDRSSEPSRQSPFFRTHSAISTDKQWSSEDHTDVAVTQRAPTDRTQRP